MMNQENTQAQTTINSTLTESVKSMASAVQELVELIKNEIAAEATSTTTETTATTTTDAEATETTTVGYLPCPPDAKTAEAASTTTETTATTTADAEFKGSMIEQDIMDPMPSDPTAAEATQEITDETATAEANAVADTEKMLDNIIADISALYNISSYALSNEGKNIESDRSPYAPKENKMGVIGDYQVFIAKEVIKDCDHVTGSFRLVVKDKVIVNPIMDLEFRIIDNHYKIFSSENVHRMEKMKEDHDLVRFLEITEEISALVMSRYIAD